MGAPRHTLIEALHLAAGIVGTLAVGKVAAWGVPLAAGDIWLVAWACVAIVVFWAIRPLRLAWRADRGDRQAESRLRGDS